MDDKMFRAINGLAGRCKPLDMLMILISNKIRLVFIFVLIFMWFRKCSQKVTANAITSAIVTMIIHIVMKMMYFRPRPFVNRCVGILIPAKMNSSFPSKHALLVFAISTSIFLRDRFLGMIMWGLSMLTGLSRIWVGHHYPSDIIGSALIGSITSIFVDYYSKLAEACREAKSE